MTIIIYDELEQGTDEWLTARCGILTASVIGKLITPSTLKVADNETSRDLIRTLAAERISGHVDYVHPTFDMQRGTEDEPYARAEYIEHYPKYQVREVGFITLEQDGIKLGYSPDGLVDDDGLIEIKSRRPKEHIKTILNGHAPAENMAQMQTGMYITGRSWCDYISYCAGMPMWVKRVDADPGWFHAIQAAARAFEDNIREYIEDYEVAIEGFPATERRDMEFTF